jgi:hypothetical protein
MRSSIRRRAVVVNDGQDRLAERVGRYLPANYNVVNTDLHGNVVISGFDNAGWTLDGYVIPRLLSGLYACNEVCPECGELTAERGRDDDGDPCTHPCHEERE